MSFDLPRDFKGVFVEKEIIDHPEMSYEAIGCYVQLQAGVIKFTDIPKSLRKQLAAAGCKFKEMK